MIERFEEWLLARLPSTKITALPREEIERRLRRLELMVRLHDRPAGEEGQTQWN